MNKWTVSLLCEVLRSDEERQKSLALNQSPSLLRTRSLSRLACSRVVPSLPHPLRFVSPNSRTHSFNFFHFLLSLELSRRRSLTLRNSEFYSHPFLSSDQIWLLIDLMYFRVILECLLFIAAIWGFDQPSFCACTARNSCVALARVICDAKFRLISQKCPLGILGESKP